MVARKPSAAPAQSRRQSKAVTPAKVVPPKPGAPRRAPTKKPTPAKKVAPRKAVKAASAKLPTIARARRKIGPIEAAVRRDLRSRDVEFAMRDAMASLAYKLAAQVDLDEGASRSASAAVAGQLQTVLRDLRVAIDQAELTGEVSPDDAERAAFLALLGQPD